MQLHESPHNCPLEYKDGHYYFHQKIVKGPTLLQMDGQQTSLIGLDIEEMEQNIRNHQNIEMVVWANDHTTHEAMSHITELCWKNNIGIEFIGLDGLISLCNTLSMDARRYDIYLLIP